MEENIIPASCGTETGETSANPGQEQTSEQKWEAMLADPVCNQRFQQTVQSRLRQAKAAEEHWQQLQPVLRQLEQRHGVAEGDWEGLRTALEQEESGQEVYAEQSVLSPFAVHFAALRQQAEQLRQQHPDFDLEKQLEDPAFVRLTAPGTGLSVADAYYALHRSTLEKAAMETAARQTARSMASAIRSGAARPTESGANAPIIRTLDYRHATAQQRDALKQRIRAAAARGEKVYPG